MTTLATMKARIASELRRSDLTSQIADAIETAIESYQGERFWFNTKRSTTFDTVADQEFYTSTDISNIEKIDYVYILIGDQPYRLMTETPADIERLNQSGTTTGQPLSYSNYDGQIRLYPIPEQAYTIRIGGQIQIAAPADDGELNNPWMVEAERLIRHRATFEVASHVLRDQDIAQYAATGVEAALSQLRSRTANRQALEGWCMTPTSF